MANASEPVAALSPLKRALLALDDMKSRLDVLERSRTEPIAIVGIGCRFPGGSSTPDRFWELLRDGVDAVSDVPRNRWEWEAFFDPRPDTPGKTYSHWGGFLDDVGGFDPQFFGIAPREAAGIDPQQRLLLEVAWEAFENAGASPDKLSGTRTGVFIGINSIDYAALQLQTADLSRMDAYSASGSAHSIAAGRLSYVLGLQGPSMAVDTACSSSLVAVHLACQSLRSDECRMAVAGGVQLTMAPLNSVVFSKLHMLAADGRCKTFDARGDGFVEGEGCGVVVLKRLSDAVSDGDRVLAVIRGSAVNQDGASSGLTAPNGPAQEAVIRTALERGQVRPAEVGYVEAHGTGTALGDPIEVQALGAVYGTGRSKDVPLIIGSVKTNIGHTAAAAGVAGLIKLVLALEQETIPPSLHFDEPNAYIPWADLPVRVATEPIAWPRGEARRVGGVSSFGFSGTNVHVVVEEAPVSNAAPHDRDRPIHLLTLSARSDAALNELAGRLSQHLEAGPLPLADVAFTANAGRAHFANRVVITAESIDEARASLAAVAAGAPAPGTLRATVPTGDRPRIAFLCTGQGAQYVGMGRELSETQPTFRHTLDRCADVLRGELEQPLLSVLYPDQAEASPIDQTAYAQPALFAFEYALAELWKSWGVVPSAVLGHSVGEYVAACLAGVLSLNDALKLVAARGRLMQSLPRGGVMAAVFADEARVRAAIEPDADRVSVAAVNGPQAIVVSGPEHAVERVLARLGADGVHHERLVVSHAFHSSLMDPVLAEFEPLAQGVAYARPRLTLISNLTGGPVQSDGITAAYWRRHLREPVQFAKGVSSLGELGFRIFIELGPKPTLAGMARASLPADAVLLPSVRKADNGWRDILQSVAELYARGVEIDWVGFDRDYPRRKVALPTYPFERRRHWLSGLEPRAGNSRARRRGTHPLLGTRLSSALKDVQFESEVCTDSPAFLGDHRKQGAAIFPATAYLEMGLAAAREALGDGSYVFEELTITEPLQLGAEPTKLQSVLSPDGQGNAAFQLCSCEPAHDVRHERWRVHGAGTIRVSRAGDQREADPLDIVRSRCSESIPVDEYYQLLLDNGHQYGPSFRGVVALWRGELQALARIELPESVREEASSYRIHPVLLDAAMQILAAAVPESVRSGAKGEMFLPISLGRCQILLDGVREAWSHVTLRDLDGEGFWADVRVYDEHGHVAAQVEDVYHRRVSASEPLDRAPVSSWLYELTWQQSQREPVASVSGAGRGTWLILGDPDGLGSGLARRFEEAGIRTVMVGAAASYERSGTTISMEPANAAHHVRMFEDACTAHDQPVEGVVHLWSLGGPPSGDATIDTLESSLHMGCGSVLALLQAIVGEERTRTPRLCLATCGAAPVTDHRGIAVDQAPVWGLARAVMAEHPELMCTCVDLDPAAPVSHVDSLYNETRAAEAENQIAFRDGMRYVARLTQSDLRIGTDDRKTGSQPMALEISERGILDRLELRPVSRRPPGPGEVEVRVSTAGLNFRDVLNALGLYAGEPGPLGAECVGTIVAVGAGVAHLAIGQEVFGMALGGLRNYVTSPAGGFVVKPETLTAAEAATVPVAFLTADYALNHIAHMAKGERVLIHAAAGGVGLAAVQLAQRAGAEVFATAGSPDKHAFLKSLGVQHVMSSRSVDFADEVRTLTGGEGVDIVLNSLAGDFIDKSVSVVREGGRFVEIGRAGIWTEEQMAAVRPDVHYFPVLLSHDKLEIIQPMLEALRDAFDSGSLQALPYRTFPFEDAVDAFRYMAQAKHIGKIVLTLDGDDSVSRPRSLETEATYLITGGLGALGLRVARWMVDAGARHLVLAGRSLPSTKARETITELQASGADVVIAPSDVSDETAVSQLISDIREQMPPLRGIVHAAGVVDDGVLGQQTWDRFEKVLAPKVAGAWNLHRATESAQLDFFVLFSSMVSLFGGRGQGSYAAANAFLDGLAHHRRSQHLPALSINWGPWDDDGMAAGVSERDRLRWREQGFGSIPPDEGVSVLGRLIATATRSQVAVVPVDWPRLFQQLPADQMPPVLATLAHQYMRRVSAPAGRQRRLLADLETVAPNRRRSAVMAFMQEEAIKVLGLDASTSIDSLQPLRELGLDSLMAVELRNAIGAALERTLPATLLFKHPTLEALSDFIMSHVPSASDWQADTDVAPSRDDADLETFESLSDEETKRLLVEELQSLSTSAWTSEP